jgi:hypothetical protein
MDAGFDHALAKQVCDVVASTQDVGDDQVEREGPRDVTYRLRDVDGGVKRLGEKQGHHDGGGMAGLGELPGGRIEVWLRQIKVSRHGGDLCQIGNCGHQPLDAATAPRMSATVREPDQWELGMFRQRVSRCGV